MVTKKIIQQLAYQFFLSGEVLYKKSYDNVILRCVDVEEANEKMLEVREGACGPHMSGHMVAHLVLGMGYYWSTMENDYSRHVRKCHLSRIYANRIPQSSVPLHKMTNPLPFSVWGTNAISMTNPKASNSHGFILVAVCYLTKCVKTTSFELWLKGRSSDSCNII